MRAMRKTWAGSASLLLIAASVAWLGIGASTSTSAGPDGRTGPDERARQALGLRTVSSVAQAKRIAARHGVEGRTLTVVTHELDWQYVDLPPEGDSMGDFFWSTGDLYDADHETVIGTQILKCEFTNEGGLCEQPLQIDGRGKILLSNPIIGDDDVVAVTGGTGDFRKARGQAVLTVLDNGDVFDILFVIDLGRRG